MSDPIFGLSDMTDQQASAAALYNEMLRVIGAFAAKTAKSATTTAQPGSPNDGDLYVLNAGSGSLTGSEWSVGSNGYKVALFYNSLWHFFFPNDGWRFFAQDEDAWYTYSATSTTWLRTRSGDGSVQIAITANANNSQSTTAILTAETCVVTTSTSSNNSVKLPTAQPGLSVLVVVDAGVANTVNVFPASSGTIDNGGSNAAVTIAAGHARLFKGVSSTNWRSLVG